MRRFIIIVLAALMSVPLFAQNVTNTDCRQDGKKIVVTYSLDKPADIELWYSTDGGKSYKGPLKKVSGDVGRNVRSGNNSIVWDVLEEVESLVGTGIVFKVVPGSAMAVDLGLSVKWASCNLGAGKPEDYGDYYAWGETRTKSVYNDSHAYKGDPRILPRSADVASVKLGGKWRMPTYEEWDELINKCTWTWKNNYNGTGVNGRLVTGPNGNSIFLPAAGNRYGTNLYNAGSTGNYWSSSLDTGTPSYAWYVNFNSSNVSSCSSYRCFGRSVRPVTE